MHVPPVENPAFAAFEVYEEVPETVPLNFTEGDTHVRVLLPEDICNRSPGFSALVIREETPSLLPFCCPTDGLPELPRYHGLMKSPGHGIVLLLAAEGGPALSAAPSTSTSPARPVYWSLSQRSMRHVILARILWARRTTNVFVRTTWEKTRCLSEFQLRDIIPCHSAARIAMKRCPTAPKGVAYQLADSAASRRQRLCHASLSAIPLQVRPVVVMREVSIDFLQQKVRTFRGESQEVCVFLWGGGVPPHASDLYRAPP